MPILRLYELTLFSSVNSSVRVLRCIMFRNVLLRPWASFCASALSPEAMYRGTIGTARFCAITLPETRRMSSTVGSPVDSSRIQSNGASPARLDPSFQQHAEELLQVKAALLRRPVLSLIVVSKSFFFRDNVVSG